MDFPEKSRLNRNIFAVLFSRNSVFSAFSNQIKIVSREYNVDPSDVFFELGKEKVIGGQEDKIVEVAIRLSKRLGK